MVNKLLVLKRYWIWVILLLSLIIRFYDLQSTQPFDLDEARDAWTIRAMVRDGIFPVVGPIASVGQLHLGPLYY